MQKSRFAEERIAYSLPQVESDTAVAGDCRQLGVREAKLCVSTKTFAHVGLTKCAASASSTTSTID